MSKKYGNYAGTASANPPTVLQAPGGWNNNEVVRQQALEQWPSYISAPLTAVGTIYYAASSGVADTLIQGDYLIPSGQSVSRSTYASLYATYGDFFGPGDLSTTFELPNAIRSFESFYQCSTVSGNAANLTANGVLPQHTHTVRIGVTSNAGQDAGGNPQQRDSGSFTFYTSYEGSLAGNTPKRQYLAPILSLKPGEALGVGVIFPCLLGSASDVIGNLALNTLVCDGSAVSRTTYSELYGLIGDLYGPGDGSTTFNTPDLRGVFVGNPYPNPSLCSGTIYPDEFARHLHSNGSRSKGNPSSSPGTPFAVVGSQPPATFDGTATGVESRPTNFNVIYCLVASQPV
jgi:microcystin-dependent protein